jgi:cob(I)alamin adenosyltransferase
MRNRPESFDAIEEAWRKRVESARERYLAAVSDVKRVAEMEKEPSEADRGPAREQVRRAEREALAQYLVVLETFKDLVLKGKIPPED